MMRGGKDREGGRKEDLRRKRRLYRFPYRRLRQGVRQQLWHYSEQSTFDIGTPEGFATGIRIICDGFVVAID